MSCQEENHSSLEILASCAARTVTLPPTTPNDSGLDLEIGERPWGGGIIHPPSPNLCFLPIKIQPFVIPRSLHANKSLVFNILLFGIISDSLKVMSTNSGQVRSKPHPSCKRRAMASSFEVKAVWCEVTTSIKRSGDAQVGTSPCYHAQ